jgi:Phospholipase_D-nuclease N-terminal
MLFFDGAVGLALLGLWVFCLLDVATTPDEHCRNLPKLLWLLVVIVLPAVGSVLWLVAGRTQGRPARLGSLPYKGNSGALAPRPTSQRASSPDDDEDFLRGLRARAEEQRRRGEREAGPDAKA